MLAQFFFIYLAAALISLSLVVITRRNPVHSVLFMLVLFFHIAVLYLFLNAEFLAAVQVIVYAGAILVLFLFVVLLLNLKEELLERKYSGAWPFGAALASALFVAIAVTLSTFKLPPEAAGKAPAAGSNVETVGKALYTEYLLPFEVASLVLLVAIVGAIVLAKKRLKS